MSLFNEIEPFAAAWLRTMHGDSHVDTRSIADLQPADIAGFRRVHFFAGIGGWEEALRIAGWPKEREIWTGSAPCQPFSVAGKRGGTADERHLWPEMFRLIRECHPATAMGEQVSSKDGLLWLDGVFADLEAEGYTCWAVDTCAAGVSAPHIRQRLYWVAESDEVRHNGRKNSTGTRQPKQHHEAKAGDESLPTHRLEHAASDGRDARRAESERGSVASGCGTDGLVFTNGDGQQQGRASGETTRYGSASNTTGCHDAGYWSNYRIEQLTDGTQRRIESSLFALAHGIPRDVGPIVAELGKLGINPETARRIIANARRNRTGRLRGYGNAIVPQVAVEFIRSFMEAPCN